MGVIYKPGFPAMQTIISNISDQSFLEQINKVSVS